jgi:hypothetical protein
VLTTDASGNITLPHQVNLGGAQKLMPDQAGQAGKMLVSDGTNAAWQEVLDPLPSQSGNSGKFLSTDGSSASWGSVPDPVPAQAGNSGKFLSTDGSSASWQEVLQDFAPRLGVKNFVVDQNFNADSDTVEGDLWYDSANQQLKLHAGGNQTTPLVIGFEPPKTWSVAPGGVAPGGPIYLGATLVGTPNDLLLVGGANSTGTTYNTYNRTYNGAAWSTSAVAPFSSTGVQYHASCGTSTNSLHCGGEWEVSVSTARPDAFTYNGTAFTAVADMPAWRFHSAFAGGSPSDAIVVGGKEQSFGSTANITQLFRYNGTTWSAFVTHSFDSHFNDGAGFGNFSEFVVGGGGSSTYTAPYTGWHDAFYYWNGSTFTTLAYTQYGNDSANSNATPSSRGFFYGQYYGATIDNLIEYDSGLGDLKVADAEDPPFVDSNGMAVGDLANGAAYFTGDNWSSTGASAATTGNEVLFHFA